MKTDTVRFAVMRALDRGLDTEPAIKAFVAGILGRAAPVHTMTLVAAIRCAKAVVAHEPCDGTKRSRAMRQILRGLRDEDIAVKLRTSPGAVSDWRNQLSWVCEAGAARSPRKRAKASIDWTKGGTAPPLRRSKRAVWEYVMDVLADGYEDLNEITLMVQEHVDETATRKSIESIYMDLVNARLALNGYADDSQGNRIARALLAWRGNGEAAYECEAPVTVVAGIRNALRRIDAARVPLDPTFHLQPIGQALPSWVPPVGGPVPWTPPKARPPLPPAEGKPVGIKAAAEREFRALKTNAEVRATLAELFPNRVIKSVGVAQLRAELRHQHGPERIPTDYAVRRVRGEKRKNQKQTAKRARIAPVAEQAIRDGQTDAEVLRLVQSKFPDAKTTLASIQTYRTKMRKTGENIPTDRSVKKLRELEPA